MDGVINRKNLQFQLILIRKILMLPKRYGLIEVDCRTWLHVPSETHWSTSRFIHHLKSDWLTIWTICAFREINPCQWSLAKQSSLKVEMVVGKCQTTSWSQKRWCNKPTQLQFQVILIRKIWSTDVDRRTWLHVPSGTLLSTSSDTHQVVEI